MVPVETPMGAHCGAVPYRIGRSSTELSSFTANPYYPSPPPESGAFRFREDVHLVGLQSAIWECFRLLRHLTVTGRKLDITSKEEDIHVAKQHSREIFHPISGCKNAGPGTADGK
jgi:hypothetical protein